MECGCMGMSMNSDRPDRCGWVSGVKCKWAWIGMDGPDRHIYMGGKVRLC